MNEHDLDAAVSSEKLVEVRRRIFRQLIESLIYEKIIHPESGQDGPQTVFRLHGLDGDGRRVTYLCRGRMAWGFDRIRLASEPVLRIVDDEVCEAESLSQFLLEIRSLHGAGTELLLRFIHELEQTLLKDSLAQYHRKAKGQLLRGCAYDEIEAGLADGHPYHPSYKSRIGFNYAENLAFGPEFSPLLSPVLLGAHREWTRLSVSRAIDPVQFLQDELGPDKYGECIREIHNRGLDPDQYFILPVHPWQWREQVVTHLFEDLRNDRLIFFGSSNDAYLPQQSIRTLANRDVPAKAYLKHSLSIVNTSTSRILAPHTVQNAPLISDWLKEIVEQDPFLRDEMRPIILREVLGAAYDRPQPELLHPATYGVLSCIWRESLHPFLAPGEQAVPWNALCHLDLDSDPFIADWIRRHEIEPWTRRLLETSILPIIHFLCAHGIALESHAQNMILIHRAGVPQRVALRDFHDGIRFAPELLARPEMQPGLHPTPAHHARINRNSFIITEDPAQVRDFLLDAFFFINLSELSIFLDERFSLSERRFWSIADDIINQYQRRFSHLQDRFCLFDLYRPAIQVERLTRRRLFPETDIQVHSVRNPLHRAMEESNRPRSD
jgi:2-[(L-alanin-3-ylcarbamoyl)methyl]-3-(2-aminoethylcarbamoyl)-2-hydroxypropanoate synthase